MSTNNEAAAKSHLNLIAAVGLVFGGLFGMLGTMVAARNLQSACWAVDGVGVVVGTALLAVKLFRKGSDIVAAGFLVFTIGESVMLAGTATTLVESVPTFAAGTALWSAGLLLTSAPKEFAGWIRGSGLIATVLFAITSGTIFWGAQTLPTARPLPFFAYPFLVLTFIGWIWTLLKSA